jgi:hypothetical protein
VLSYSELQCGGLASREFVSHITACRHESLVVCVCGGGGCFVYQVDTGWVGLDGMWGSFVCYVSIGGDGGAEGKCGWRLDRCINEE